MLQRQSNSLAARAASLADDLADKSALVEALQQDRARLERELAQSHSRPSGDGADAPGHGDAREGQHPSPAQAIDTRAADDGDVSPSAPRLDQTGAGNGVAATGGETAVDGAAPGEASAAGTVVALAAAVEEGERKAREAVAAAEARCLALTEMVDSLVAEKVAWEEERTAGAAEAMRLRALVRGLEEAVIDRGVGDEADGNDSGRADGRAQPLVEELRKLLRERTRELEVKSVAMERLGKSRVLVCWVFLFGRCRLSQAR